MEDREPFASTSNSKRKYGDYEFWFLWALATAIAFGPGSVVAYIISLSVSSDMAPIISGIVIFSLVGVLQWLVLRNRLQKIERLVFVTLFGWYLGCYVGIYIVGGRGGWYIYEFADSIIEAKTSICCY